ncbi:unnamed protein product [Meganyctiphanes norvegica]|uniref:UNC-45/Cro1/She4 central domain-containing protein n=1 Tax=Meganyctiphanes norvegica TaxID=48144 RepID=A0AAV2SCF9_MEGNR
MAEKTPTQFKDEGNAAYKEGDWNKAIDKYTEGLKLSKDTNERAVLYKNRAAVFLKNEEFEKVVKDCTACLEITPTDPKALFRRAQAYVATELPEKAYVDAMLAQKSDPKNKELQAMLASLHMVVQNKMEENHKVSGKVKQLFDILFDSSMEKDKRETCANNLVALAREKAGAELLLKEGILGRLVLMLKTEKNTEIKLACTRSIGAFSTSVERVQTILKECGLPWLLDLMNSTHAQQVNAGQYVFQVMLNTLAGMDLKKERKSDKNLKEENKTEIDTIMAVLIKSVTNRTMSGICRDSVIELITRNVVYEALDWGEKLIKIGGVEALMDVASELEEYHYESAISITDNTRITTSICMAKVYESRDDDKKRGKFYEQMEQYLQQHLLDPTMESKVRVAVAITTLLLGPLDLGNQLISREGILEMIMVMASSEEVLEQKVACEALIAAASKKDKCRAIITQGVNILKKLYQSKDDSIRVRALVGLCKLGSMGGTDASMKPFAEGAGLKLAEACRRFLVNPTKDREMRRWSCEGLSYLTLDADVKERLIEDLPALRSMIELAKSGDLNCLYGVVTTFCNLMNAYDKQEIIPEMMELAKFAKQHIPEEHELDEQDFVDKRVSILVEEGAGAALVALSKTESHNSKELIARLFNGMVSMAEHRGLVVQQGGTKALLGLAMDGTKKGKLQASQALARIAITINPEQAFPGQRAYEVVRPLLKLLALDVEGLMNFEGLMGLTNLAGMSESVRQRIIKEKGIGEIEHYMFEYHEMIRRAAIQCMCNMCMSPDVIKQLEGQNDKFKYLFLCTADEDEEIIKAAAGALCMVLPESERCCKKVFDAKDWEDTLKFILTHPVKEIQYRGTIIVYHLVATDKETARRVMETHCKDALKAIANITNPELCHPKAREFAHDTLKLAAQEYDLVDDPDIKED